MMAREKIGRFFLNLRDLRSRTILDAETFQRRLAQIRTAPGKYVKHEAESYLLGMHLYYSWYFDKEKDRYVQYYAGSDWTGEKDSLPRRCGNMTK